MNTATLAADRIATRMRGTSFLGSAFALFNGLRSVAYLPTLAAIQTSGQGDRQSPFTRLTLLGANLTMALRLREQNGRRINRTVAVNAFSAFIWGAIAASIAWLRRLQPDTTFTTLF